MGRVCRRADGGAYVSNDTTALAARLAELENDAFIEEFGEDAEFTNDDMTPVIAYHIAQASNLARQFGVTRAKWVSAMNHAYKSELHDEQT